MVVLTGFIYPIVGHWTWGGGWLVELGFMDFAGSTMAVTLTNASATMAAQAAGVAAIGAFVFILSLVCWSALRLLAGLRLHPEHENRGGDLSELGVRAYNLT